MQNINSLNTKEKESNAGTLKITIEDSVDSEVERRARKITISIDEIDINKAINDSHEAKATKMISDNYGAHSIKSPENTSHCDTNSNVCSYQISQKSPSNNMSRNKESCEENSSEQSVLTTQQDNDESVFNLCDSDDGNEINILNNKKSTLDHAIIDIDGHALNQNNNTSKLGQNQSRERKRKKIIILNSKTKRRRNSSSIIDTINSSGSSDVDDNCKELISQNTESHMQNSSLKKGALISKIDNTSLVILSDSDLESKKNTLDNGIIDVDEIKENNNSNMANKLGQNQSIDTKCKSKSFDTKTKKKLSKRVSSIVDNIISSDSSESDDYCKQLVTLGIKRKTVDSISVNESSDNSDCEILNQDAHISSLRTTKQKPLNSKTEPICLTDCESDTSSNETVVDVDNNSRSSDSSVVDVETVNEESSKNMLLVPFTRKVDGEHCNSEKGREEMNVDVGQESSCKVSSSCFAALVELCLKLDNSPSSRSLVSRRACHAFRQASSTYKYSERFASLVSDSMKGLRQFPAAARDCLDDLIDCLMLHRHRQAVPRLHFASPTTAPLASPSGLQVQAESAPCPPQLAEGSSTFPKPIQRLLKRDASSRGLMHALRVSLREARQLERVELALADPASSEQESLYCRMHNVRETVVRIWKQVQALRARRRARRRVRVVCSDGSEGCVVRAEVAACATKWLRAQPRGSRLPRPLHYEAALHLVRAAVARVEPDARLAMNAQRQQDEAVAVCACVYASVSGARRRREWRHLQLLSDAHHTGEEMALPVAEDEDCVPVIDPAQGPTPAVLAALMPAHAANNHPYRVVFSSDSEASVSLSEEDSD